LVCALLILGWQSPARADVVIGIVEDGPLPRPLIPLAALEAEIRGLVGDEFEISMPAGKRLDGGWTIGGVRGAIRRQLDDPDVDIVITTGLISSNEAARFAQLSKPVIASIVADMQLQELPAERMANKVVSGKRNLVYLARVRVGETGAAAFEQTNVDEAIDLFHDAVEFGHMAILLDALTIESIPSLASVKARDVERRLGVRTSVIPFRNTVAEVLAAIPGDTDAVLVGPLLRLEHAQMRELAAGLIDRRLPSFALLGRSELASGLLMTSGGREEDAVRYSRRLALNVQRILLGDAAEEIDVRIAEPQRLAINMQTAAAIGFYPRYAVLSDAEQLFGDELEEGDPLSLADAMAEALGANLGLSAAKFEPLIAAEETRLAFSQLLPQFGVGVRAVRIDEDRANPVVQAERSTDAEVSGSQVVYSDDARAAWQIAGHLQTAADFGYQVEALDTLQAAASGYLAVLRARALERVQRSNLEVTRTNLELARLRQSIGASGRGDVLRWESQLATDRQNLVAAESDRRVALVAFNRVLNRPQNRPFVPTNEDIAQSIALFEDERFRAFIDNAAVWELFQDFLVESTLRQAPELMQFDRLLAAQRRQVTAAKRRYYVPELALGGTWGSNLDRSGAGSDLSLTGLDDESWSIGLSASWPLFTGGALKAQLNGERFSLRQLERSRAALAEQLETRTRVALHRASGTYPSLEFSVEAAQAAAENLGLVTDAYRSGAVSVTELIDAQNAALAAQLRSVDAQYAYLVDVVDILRATGDFTLLVDPGSTEPWFQDVESFIRNRGGRGRR
jgi:outer membrane protein TolC